MKFVCSLLIAAGIGCFACSKTNNPATTGTPIDTLKTDTEARDNLWAGLEEEATVISNINSRPTDPSNASGYTLVFVHTWTKDLSSIKTVVDGLNKNVRVVTPDAFIKLVKTNLGGK